MNVSTVVVLVIVALLVALAVRSLVKKSRAGHCAGCSDGSSCCTADDAAHGKAAPCAAARRALADVEARLGPKAS